MLFGLWFFGAPVRQYVGVLMDAVLISAPLGAPIPRPLRCPLVFLLGLAFALADGTAREHAVRSVVTPAVAASALAALAVR